MRGAGSKTSQKYKSRCKAAEFADNHCDFRILNCNTISFSIETNVKMVPLAKNGAGDRNRTYDLRVTSALLYRLSYTGVGPELITSIGVAQQRGNNKQ